MNSLCKHPVFVVGVFRSGTSLLSSLLNQHPAIGLMYECDVWDFSPPLLPARFRGDWLRRQEFYNQALSRHRLIFGGSLRGLEQVKTPDDLYQTFAAGRGATVWGEKSPPYANRLRLLAQRYPGASFILIWRDPAETYRSILAAGRTSPFFRRRGMFDRLIACHEIMVRDTRWLKQHGARVCEIEYPELVENPEAVGRRVCDFLQLEFTPRMASLQGADFTGVFEGKHHDHLRRGIIAHRRLAVPLTGPETELLKRFHHRWLALRQDRPAAAPQPSWSELTRYRLTGGWYLGCDQAVRALYEFLPLPWLRQYRQLKPIFSAGEGRPATAVSLPRQVAAHYPTIIAAYALIALIATFHYQLPHLILLPLYLFPCGLLTLKLNQRWGAVACVIAAAIGPAILMLRDPAYGSAGVLLWNTLMRLFTLWITVVLFRRVLASAGAAEKTAG
jgi:Sulfotransferase family